MKIIHLNFMRKISSGQLKQLEWEKEVGVKRGDWDTLVYHDYPSVDDIVKQVPWLFRNIFLRNLFAWYIILKFRNKYDYVLVRHITFDIYSFVFSPFIKNRCTVHHAKEVSELKMIRSNWKGKLASYVEDKLGRRLLRNNKAIFGVTSEIALYEVARAGKDIPMFFYPNGVSYSSVALVQDKREDKVLNILFMCGKFSDWHGLDNILKSVHEHEYFQNEKPIKLHLIGTLSDKQMEYINNDVFLSTVCEIYGILKKEQYINVFNICDVGLGSFALYRKDLNEGATLKVREMLASGLPVVSGHKDTAFPNDFLYYKNYGSDLRFNIIYDFFKAENVYSRKEVRDISRKYISKEGRMFDVINYLKGL